MTLSVLYNGSWINLKAFLPAEPMDGSVSDVDGPGTGKNLLGKPIRDIINKEVAISFVSRYCTDSECNMLMAALSQEDFSLRTDYFTDTEKIYTECHVSTLNKGKPLDGWAKVSGTIIFYEEN